MFRAGVLCLVLLSSGCASINPWKDHPVAELGSDVTLVKVQLQSLRTEIAASRAIPAPRKANLDATLDHAWSELEEAMDLLSQAGSADVAEDKIKRLIQSASYRCDSVRAVLDFGN